MKLAIHVILEPQNSISKDAIDDLQNRIWARFDEIAKDIVLTETMKTEGLGEHDVDVKVGVDAPLILL